MFREYEKSISYIYENDLVTKGKFEEKTTDRDTMRIQSSELTGSDCVKIRNYRAAVVCLVLLCVLLLTAVIVLYVTLTNERDQLMLKNTDLTYERDQLGNELQIRVGWAYYQFSLYYISNETKNWIESRRYCLEKGGDLIIINNREEDNFVKKRFGGTTVWIGLTDINVEGRWKWVDGSTLTSGSWWPGEPSGRTIENCVVAVDNDQRWSTLFGWFDVQCDSAYQWICEKRI